MSHLSLPIARPLLGQEEADAAARAILSGWVTQGKEVAAFEHEVAEYVGAPHAVAVSSGTTALHLALLIAEVGEGDEVITASHSFIATANVIRHCGAMPVFADIDPRTFNLDPASVAANISGKTKAILVVHQLGMPCDPAILELARSRNILVIEDAACAIGSEIRIDDGWEKIGRPHGDLACFSFHPRKLLTTGDGGMITTANREWDARLRLLRQHGMSVNDAVRHASPQVVFEDYPIVGYNYRLTDIQAAVGREQLRRLPQTIPRRRELAAMYAGAFRGTMIEAPFEPEYARSNWQSYCVRLPDEIDQRRVMQRMLDEGIATRRGVMCAHREAAYPAGTWRMARTLSESERAQDHCVILPLFPQMEDADVSRVADALLRSCRP